jgi:hypothetical protein
VKEKRLDRFVLRDILEFKADDNPMAAPRAERAVKICLVEPVSHPQKIIVEQQTHCSKQVGFLGPVFANNRIDPAIEPDVRAREIAIVD